MKHVFWIHSHTLYMSARGVINKLQLPYKDVIFILEYNYKSYDMPDEIQTFNFFHHPKSYWEENIREKIKILDNFIEEIIGEEFIFYVSHLCTMRFQVIVTNKRCVDIKFIQEGIIDFCRGYGKNKKKILKTLFSPKFILNAGRVWDYSLHLDWDYCPLGVPNVSETFAISDKLFSNVHCKHTIIQWPEFKLPIELEDNSVYFVFGAMVEDHFIERDLYMQATEKMIKKYAKADACNYVKFHPRQTDNNILYIIYLFFKNGFKVRVLPNDVPFEAILASKRHIEVCGFTSSLIFFADLMPQHEAHICASALYSSTQFVKGYWEDFMSHLTRCYGDKFKFEDLADVNLSRDSVDSAKVELPHGLSYARIDIKNEGSSGNDIDILEISDAAASVTTPKWMHKNGSGCVVKSENGALVLKFRCVGNGKVIITLRGADIRDENNRRIPFWVDYTKFNIDGRVMINNVTPIWHDKPLKHVENVKDNQIIDMYVEWKNLCWTVGTA